MLGVTIFRCRRPALAKSPDSTKAGSGLVTSGGKQDRSQHLSWAGSTSGYVGFPLLSFRLGLRRARTQCTHGKGRVGSLGAATTKGEGPRCLHDQRESVYTTDQGARQSFLRNHRAHRMLIVGYWARAWAG